MAQEVLVGLDHLEYPVKHRERKRGLKPPSLPSGSVDCFFFTQNLFLLSFRFPSTLNSKGSYLFFLCAELQVHL